MSEANIERMEAMRHPSAACERDSEERKGERGRGDSNDRAFGRLASGGEPRGDEQRADRREGRRKRGEDVTQHGPPPPSGEARSARDRSGRLDPGTNPTSARRARDALRSRSKARRAVRAKR